jgi:hypothetical protein
VISLLGKITKRFAACFALCLVVASVTAPVHAATRPSVVMTPTLNTMKFVFSTSVPTAVTLNMGTDKAYGLTVYDGLKKKHSITVRGLRPATQYYCAVRATPKRGKAATWSAPCATSELTSATVSFRGGNVLLGGVPSFVTALYMRECPDENTLGLLDRLGSQTVTAGSCLAPPPADNSEAVQRLDSLLSGKAWWLEPNTANLPQLSSLTMLLGARESFNFPTDPGSLLGCGSHSGVGLANAVAEAGSAKPAIADLYIASQLTRNIRSCLDGPRLKALIWEAVAKGAKGIELVPQLPWNSQYSVSPEVEQQAKALSSQLATFQPALLTAAAAVSANAPLVIGARRYLGSRYVVAVNPTLQSAKAVVNVGRTTSKLASVWKEGRKVKLKSGKFSDSFAPLAVHIYTLR